MNPATIAALATAIVSIIGAVTAAIVAIKGNGTMAAHINSHAGDLPHGHSVEKDPS